MSEDCLVEKGKKMLMVQLTYDCNMDCVHCAYGDSLEYGIMSIQSFREILSKYGEEYDVLKISGGEPTILSKIESYLSYADEYFDRTILYTNGTHLGDLDYDGDYLVSYYGHQWMIDSIVDKIEEHQEGPLSDRITLNTPVFNAVQLFDAAHDAKELGFPLRIVKLQPHGQANNNLEVLPYEEQCSIARDVLEEYRDTYVTCSLFGEPRCDDKLTIKPDGTETGCTAEIKGLKCARLINQEKGEMDE